MEDYHAGTSGSINQYMIRAIRHYCKLTSAFGTVISFLVVNIMDNKGRVASLWQYLAVL